MRVTHRSVRSRRYRWADGRTGVLGNHDRRSRVASRVGRAQARVAAHAAAHPERNAHDLPGREESGWWILPSRPHLVQDPLERNVPGFNLGRDPLCARPCLGVLNHTAGFTAGQPRGFPLGADADVMNALNPSGRDPRSILSLYRALLRLRRDNDVLLDRRLEAVGGDRASRPRLRAPAPGSGARPRSCAQHDRAGSVHDVPDGRSGENLLLDKSSTISLVDRMSTQIHLRADEGVVLLGRWISPLTGPAARTAGEPGLEIKVTSPITVPPPVHGGGRNELPAYVANGVMGLRVREMPTLAAGLDPSQRGYTPWSIHSEGSRRSCGRAFSIRLPGATSNWKKAFGCPTRTHAVTAVDQARRPRDGEPSPLSRFEFDVAGRKARVEVLVRFCSRDEPEPGPPRDHHRTRQGTAILPWGRWLDARHVDEARAASSPRYAWRRLAAL